MKGYRKPLDFEDLWELNDEDKSESLVPKYRKHYEEQELAKKTQAQSRRSRFEQVFCNSLFMVLILFVLVKSK